MLRWFAALTIAVAVIALGGFAFFDQNTPTPPEPDGAAPDFTLTSLDGETISLSDFRGQPVILNFWASWCVPCKQEMTDLMRIQEEYAADGLVILAINMTFDDNLSEVQRFVDDLNLTLPVLLDQTNEVTRGQYRVVGVPTSVMIDRQGRQVDVHMGAMSGEQIRDAAEALIQNR
jgi:peroxiredoxin